MEVQTYKYEREHACEVAVCILSVKERRFAALITTKVKLKVVQKEITDI